MLIIVLWLACADVLDRMHWSASVALLAVLAEAFLTSVVCVAGGRGASTWADCKGQAGTGKHATGESPVHWPHQEACSCTGSGDAAYPSTWLLVTVLDQVALCTTVFQI